MFELDDNVVDSFPMGAHSADQPTASDTPPAPVSSGTADPMDTGTF